MADVTGLTDNDIAIVGMAAHLPGASTVAQYWSNLAAGVESIRQVTKAELIANGESHARMRHRNYVPACAPLENFDHFDAEFFGFSPKEAAILDPQHRQFLEVAWEALEDAGHPPETFPGSIGVYGGCGMGSYFYFNLCSNPDLVENTGMFLLRHTGNDKDFLATRVSHIFDLKGPSVTVQTACSTSLVAVHYAVQALLTGECDMALAGGVTVELPQGRGYIYNEGEILSPDGHCHAFDAGARGTVFGSGAGVVVLRRAVDAVRDGDHVWAIIKGSAVNNDGAAKAGYLAPSVDGQARAIARAQAAAGVTADTIDYVECHGTGTFLGDPIEVAALTAAFAETTDKTGFCRIGSVKPNIGHLDAAAGVASLIKTSLALHHGQIPPSLNYTAPNPAIDFETSPFRVNDQLRDWPRRNGPRRAGVNSLGVGGTNAHVVLQEAPARAASTPSDWPFQPLVLSAKSTAALDVQARALAAHLRAHPDQPLADVAWTLKQGRRAFDKRRVIVAETHAAAADLLDGADPRRVWDHMPLDAPEVVFMFPGGGAQYAGMARALYQTEPEFADWMDRGLAILQPKLAYDIRALWLPDTDAQAANDALKRPSAQLPLTMIIEYALAKLYQSWGVRPGALVGHSMGENTAACLAGVFSFEDCIGLVHLRGTLFDTIAPGGMLSIPLDAGEIDPLLGDDLDLACINAPGLCVVSGPDSALQRLADTLAARDVMTQRIAIDVAAHSRMLDPIVARFADYLRAIPLHAPQLPVISNRTGAALTKAEATSPEYWTAHLRQTVNFAACLDRLRAPNRIYMEMGPGRALTSLAQANGAAPNQVIPALRHPDQAIPDDQWLMATIARLWACGVDAEWSQIWGDAPRKRVPLPTYAFQRKQYFIAPGSPAVTTPDLPMRIEDVTHWGWEPHWRPRAVDTDVDTEAGFDSTTPLTWLVFMDSAGLAEAAFAPLIAVGHIVIPVRPGDAFGADGTGGYRLAPERGRDGYDALLRDLVANGRSPDRIAHFWLVTDAQTFRPGSSFFHRNIEQGFYSLLFLGQALADENPAQAPHISIFTTGAAQTRTEGLAHPEKAMVAGPALVIPHEVGGVTCASCDLVLPALRRGKRDFTAILPQIHDELLARPANLSAVLRGGRRMEKTVKASPLPDASLALPPGAPVLLTGGFGGIGLVLAEHLMTAYGAKIALIARQPLPPQVDWPAYLAAHSPNDATARRITALQHLQSLGEVAVITADVANAQDMQAAKAQITARFGRLHTVIHAAGIIDDSPLLAKTPAGTEAVFAAKLHGTKVLAELFADGEIARLILFSSTSTLTGPVGQVDYVAANAYLNAYAQSRQGGKTHVTALNWGIWSDVGMAADALAAPAPPSPRPISAPMLDSAGFDARGHRQFTAHLGPDRWVLDGHRTKSGHALIPGTGYLEIMAEAMAHLGQPVFELRDLTFLRPLDMPEIRATLAPTGAGYAFDLRSGVPVQGRTGWQLNAQAQVLPLTGDAGWIDLAAISARCGQPEIGQGLPSPQEAHLSFGPRWRVLTSRAYGAGEGIARLALPPALHAEADSWHLHPALMDLATGWAMGLIDGYTPDHLWVPVSYGRLRAYGRLPAQITSWVRNAAAGYAGGPMAVFDITLADMSGKIIVEIEGFAMRRLDGPLTFTVPDPRDLIFDDTGAKPLSAAQERLAHTLSQGILPAHGGQAFVRALALNRSQIIVSSLDIPALIAQSQQSLPTAPQGQTYARPDLDSSYIAPRTNIERTLTGFWQDLLGIAQVGVEDDFFALGGHSLTAVRLFAMVRKAYRVDFPISVLFEAPTIAACASLIDERIGPQTDKGVMPKRRFTHLVAMHERDGGPKTPLFLVAGMFGNVLNLRHLAQLIGAERPFYGLQARGLYGDQPPHTTIPDAATDYIAELRQIQPHGPYFLGGFSGGGLIAWDMARQLEAAGEEVALLALLDTPLPQRPNLSRHDKALIKLDEFRTHGPRTLLTWARTRWAWEQARRSALPPDAQGAFHNTAIEAAFRAALPQYPLPLRTGPTTLFRPPLDLRWQVTNGAWVSGAREYVFSDNDLGRFAPALDVVEVPGDHDSMVLEPNVRVLAGALGHAIAAAESGRAPLLAAAE